MAHTIIAYFNSTSILFDKHVLGGGLGCRNRWDVFWGLQVFNLSIACHHDLFTSHHIHMQQTL